MFLFFRVGLVQCVNLYRGIGTMDNCRKGSNDKLPEALLILEVS
jgi:hypothetical protein